MAACSWACLATESSGRLGSGGAPGDGLGGGVQQVIGRHPVDDFVLVAADGPGPGFDDILGGRGGRLQLRAGGHEVLAKAADQIVLPAHADPVELFVLHEVGI